MSDADQAALAQDHVTVSKVVEGANGPGRARRRKGGWGKFWASVAYALALPAILVGAWATWATFNTQPFFPGPSEIYRAFVNTWVGDAFFRDVLPSLARLGLGLALSIVIGMVAGMLIGSIVWLRELTEPLLEFFRAIPPPAMIPVVVVLMGLDDTMRVAVIVLGAVWPVLLNTIEGVRATDSVMKDTARSFAFTDTQRWRFLILPAAMPRIMTGIRQTMSIALILMVISEMFYSSAGLGYRIKYFQTNYQIAEMWSGVVLLGLVGVFMAIIFGFAERRILRWYHGLKEADHG